jgi:mannose-6-phosphate isomerase class I
MTIAPLLLRPDNFTPPSRTPWGGTRIRDRYKRWLPLPPPPGATAVVGESWEISVEPDFPSRLERTGEPLAEVLGRDLEASVGPEAAAVGGCPLLVKLLDAAENLSVQIHPDDDFAGLDVAESGKPESWYILSAEAGAGLYLGLRDGVTEHALRHAIEADEDVSRLLFFTEVRAGDFFVIEAGTPHAVGRGLTLVEPQRVLPGRRGVTYRYWDWNRRYDGSGRPDPAGAPRTLHLSQALAVTRWDAPRGQELLDRVRYRAGDPDPSAPARREPLGGEGGPIASDALQVARLVGTGPLRLQPEPRLRGLTVVHGSVRLRGDGFTVDVGCGRSAALPAHLGPTTADLEGAHAILCSASA